MKKIILCLLFIVPSCFGFNQRTKARLHGFIESSQYEEFVKLFNLSKPNISTDEMTEIVLHACKVQERLNNEVSQKPGNSALGAKIGLASSVASGAVGVGIMGVGTTMCVSSIGADVSVASMGVVIGSGVILIGVPFALIGIVGGLFAWNRISKSRNVADEIQTACTQAREICSFLSVQNNLIAQ